MNKEILYIADPMCSWCWGFSPVISSIVEDFSEHANLTLVVGGLRPGNDQVLNDEAKEVLLGHWRQVHDHTGQSFDFDLKFSNSFVLDTEPSCRAAATMQQLNSEKTLGYFKALHEAFYLNHQNITQPDILTQLATPFDVEAEAFVTSLQSEEMQQRTIEDFQFAQRLGVQGFPTVVLNDEDGYKLLCNGYQPYERLKPFLQAWVDGNLKAETS